jgi:hypothetical protein
VNVSIALSGRVFVLRPIKVRNPNTGAVVTTGPHCVEPPEELEDTHRMLVVAGAYREQAGQLLETIKSNLSSKRAEYGLPVRHLYSHAIELLLKAFLRAEGVSLDNLRDLYGHKIAKLYEECKRRGLSISGADVDPVEATLTIYLKEGHEQYGFRYFDRSIGTADPDLIASAATSLMNAVEAHFSVLIKAAAEQARKNGETMMSLIKTVVTSVGAPQPPGT